MEHSRNLGKLNAKNINRNIESMKCDSREYQEKLDYYETVLKFNLLKIKFLKLKREKILMSSEEYISELKHLKFKYEYLSLLSKLSLST